MKASKKDVPVIVLDIGGTNFRSSIFTREKGLTKKPLKVPTPNFINNPNLDIETLQKLLINMIVETITNYRRVNPKLTLIGLSFGAPITSDGVVNQASTIWGNKGKDFPLRKSLSKLLPGVRILIANDITAAAERYASMKEHRNVDYFAVIAVSSGIGSKIYDVKNRSVILDSRSVGGEMGHVKVDYRLKAPICDCGGRGHLGALSSGRAVERMAISEANKNPGDFAKSLLYSLAKKPEAINNRLLVKAIKAGDKFCLRILDRATFPLACAIAHISGGIGVDKFIIDGGFALNCGDMYLESLRASLSKTDFYSREKAEIPTLVELGINDDSDCLIGIGLLTQNKYAKDA